MGATRACSREAFSLPPGLSPPATASGNSPSAVSSIQPVQSPFGASEKIFAPHFRQILVTRIIGWEWSCFIVYCVKLNPPLRPDHRNQMTQFVFNITRSRNRVGNFLPQ